MVNYNFKPRLNRDQFGWHNRGYLPHLDAPDNRTQFLTFRLADSMPTELLDQWRKISRTDAQFRKKVEAFLDSGHGSCSLARADVATLVCNSVKFHHEKKYDLHSWVVMPNHGHIALTPFAEFHLDEIEHSIKSYTANEANKLLGRKGQFWAVECFDRYIRDDRHYRAVVRYIENNPVKAGLCRSPEDWAFGSARERWSG